MRRLLDLYGSSQEEEESVCGRTSGRKPPCPYPEHGRVNVCIYVFLHEHDRVNSAHDLLPLAPCSSEATMLMFVDGMSGVVMVLYDSLEFKV